MSSETPKTPGIACNMLAAESKTSSPMQDEEVIRKCRELLTIPGSQPDRPVSPVRQLISHFDEKFFGFIIGQRQSSLKKNVTLRRIRPTPVGKPQTSVPIKDMESHVDLEDKHLPTKSPAESPAKCTKLAEKVALTGDDSKTVGGDKSSAEKTKNVAGVESSAEKSKNVAGVESSAEKSKNVAGVESLAEKSKTAAGVESLAEKSKTAAGVGSSAEKSKTAAGVESLAEKSKTAAGVESLAEKSKTAAGVESLAEKSKTAAGVESLAEKSKTAAGVEVSEVKTKTAAGVKVFEVKTKTAAGVGSSSKGYVVEVMRQGLRGKATAATSDKGQIVESLDKEKAAVFETSVKFRISRGKR